MAGRFIQSGLHRLASFETALVGLFRMTKGSEVKKGRHAEERRGAARLEARTAGAPALVAALLLAPPALAQTTTAPDTATRAVIVQGTAPDLCRIDAATTAGLTNSRFTVADAGGGALDIRVLGDPVTGVAQPATATIIIPVICTGAHNLYVNTKGGLANASPGIGPGFATRVDYTLSANWAGQNASLTTTGVAASLNLSQTDAAAGDLTVSVNIPGGGLPLTNGAYSDEIVVQFNAAP